MHPCWHCPTMLPLPVGLGLGLLCAAGSTQARDGSCPRAHSQPSITTSRTTSKTTSKITPSVSVPSLHVPSILFPHLFLLSFLKLLPSQFLLSEEDFTKSHGPFPMSINVLLLQQYGQSTRLSPLQDHKHNKTTPLNPNSRVHTHFFATTRSPWWNQWVYTSTTKLWRKVFLY